MDHAKLVTAIKVMADTSASEAGWLAQLHTAGFEEGEARRSVAFVPIGLSRPLLERLGITDFADFALIPLSDGTWLNVRLADQPEYVAALAAAHDHFVTGSLPHEAFRAIVLSSADVVAANAALNAGKDISGGAVATAFHDLELAKHVRT